jgi:hypothetical protein
VAAKLWQIIVQARTVETTRNTRSELRNRFESFGSCVPQNLPNLCFDATTVACGSALQALLKIFLQLTNDYLGHEILRWLTDIMISSRRGNSEAGLTFGRPVTTSDSNGYTANVGLGARYYLRANVFFDFDTRYRYLGKLVSGFGQGLNTAETTLSLDYRF